MRSIERCLRDGYSTAGTAGNGLGAMARLSARFDLYSVPGQGTALLARLWSRPARRRDRPGWRSAGSAGRSPASRCAGMPGRRADAAGRTRLMLVDGLGHGAARRRCRARGGPELRAAPGAGRRGDGGTALTSPCRARAARRWRWRRSIRSGGELRFAGVGNIAGSILIRRRAARAGLCTTASSGHQVRKVREFDYPWPAGALLVMHSDGLETRWRLPAYPGLAAETPA